MPALHLNVFVVVYIILVCPYCLLCTCSLFGHTVLYVRDSYEQGELFYSLKSFEPSVTCLTAVCSKSLFTNAVVNSVCCKAMRCTGIVGLCVLVWVIVCIQRCVPVISFLYVINVLQLCDSIIYICRNWLILLLDFILFVVAKVQCWF